MCKNNDLKLEADKVCNCYSTCTDCPLNSNKSDKDLCDHIYGDESDEIDE